MIGTSIPDAAEARFWGLTPCASAAAALSCSRQRLA